MQPLELKIAGMDCAEEVAALRREVGPLAGGDDNLTFNIITGKMTVAAREQSPSADEVIRAVGRAGLKASPWTDQAPGASKRDRGAFIREMLTGVSGALVLVGFILHAVEAGGASVALGMAQDAGPTPWIAALAYSISIIAGLAMVAPKALLALRRGRADMNLLVIVAVIGALTLGDWFEASVVSFLFSLSLLLEAWSVGKARRAIEALLDVAAPTARVLGDDGVEREMPPENVAIGSIFIVKPGERFALDGVVERGAGGVNEAPITGESAPVEKSPGDAVFAGSVNGEGALEVRSTKEAGDTTLAHIIRLVREAPASVSASERWVDRFARVYTPTIMLLALLVFVTPPILFDASWGEWLYRSLVLLVIACPCALVISTPVSIVSSLASSARNGAIVKGGVVMEELAHVRAVAFDKTGTLTRGEPKVVEMQGEGDCGDDEALAIAASIESRSEHPIARAILLHAESAGVAPERIEEFELVIGRGARARIGGKWRWIGSHRWLEELGLETPEAHERLEKMAEKGLTAIAVGDDDRLLGLIGVADEIKPNAAQAIAQLRAIGVERIVMLTGDSEAAARRVQEVTGVDEVRAELLPQEKVDAIGGLARGHGHVVMVGDGVNDAPAMAHATLGVAMGAAGSDAAIETADVALMTDDLLKLPWLIGQARRTLRIVKQNIALALVIKFVFLSLAVAGLATLWAAIAADMGGTLLVTFNAMRLLRTSSGAVSTH